MNKFQKSTMEVLVAAYPDFVARFYDVIYDSIRTPVDHEFYRQRMRTAGGPVLEVGSGTGRLLVAALQDRVDAFGIDVSPAMLDILRTRIPAGEHHRVVCDDVCSMDFGRKFNLILAPFRVFSHLQSIADQLQALDRIAAHLVPGGEFVFDLFVPNPAICYQGLAETVDFDGFWQPGSYLRRSTRVRADVVHQTNHVTMRYDWWEEGREYSGTWEFDVRYYFRYELEHLIARSPLQLVRIDGDFSGGIPDENSREYVVTCRQNG